MTPVKIENLYFLRARALRQDALARRAAGDTAGYWSASSQARKCDATAYEIVGERDRAACEVGGSMTHAYPVDARCH